MLRARVQVRSLQRVCAVLVLLGATACSSVYMPRRSPRVALTMSGGSLAIVRQHRLYPVGFLGSGATDALGDLPLATEFAQTYQSRLTVGFLTTIAGGVGLIVAPATLVNSNGSRSVPTAGFILAGSLTAYVVGACLMLSAQPYLFDAVNAANDELDVPPAASPCAP
jgi:hypothetical protein